MITGHDIVALGFEREMIGKMLAIARAMEGTHVPRPEIMAQLSRRLPPLIEKIPMREIPIDFAEAIVADSPVEVTNLTSVRQKMNELLRTPVVEAGAIMPDCCIAGREEATIPVGGAIAVRNAIIPSAHSADICCSMYATFFRPKMDVGSLLDVLQGSTRFGPGGRHDRDLVNHPVNDEDVWDNQFLKGLKSYATRHMADQGDGNHFAYIGCVSDTMGLADGLRAGGYTDQADALQGEGELYVLVTHHGSRGLGAQLYKRGLKVALDHVEKYARGVPKAAAWIDYNSPEGQDYWAALQYISRWTRANHEAIHRRFVEGANLRAVTSFGNEHNFVWKRGDMFYHGKGATPAWNDDQGRPLLGLIPLNMAAPILIVLGGNNEKFLSFAPHGAGRNLSRTGTMAQFLDDNGQVQSTMVRKSIEQSTSGLDIRWFSGMADVTESPLGYKNADVITAQIQEFALANVVGVIEPMGCIMAGELPRPWERKDRSKKAARQIEHRAERRNVNSDLKQGLFSDED